MSLSSLKLLAGSTYKNERNAEAQCAQEQLRQAYANNEVHIQTLRSEIAAAATKSTDEPFCQSPIFTPYDLIVS